MLLNVFAAYLFIVKFAGPRLMQNRKPFSLNNFTRVYNLYQVICCVYIVSLVPSFIGSYNPYECHFKTRDVTDVFKLKVIYSVFLLRASEFIETVVFVLRKKQNQVSWLHVYHHLGVVSLAWIFIKYNPSKQEQIIIAINSAVHVVMYLYYFLSSFDSMKVITNKTKQLITAMQITQLVLIMTHIIHALAACNATKLYWLQLGNIVILIGMFLQFYLSSYRSDKVKTR